MGAIPWSKSKDTCVKMVGLYLMLIARFVNLQKLIYHYIRNVDIVTSVTERMMN